MIYTITQMHTNRTPIASNQRRNWRRTTTTCLQPHVFNYKYTSILLNHWSWFSITQKYNCYTYWWVDVLYVRYKYANHRDTRTECVPASWHRRFEPFTSVCGGMCSLWGVRGVKWSVPSWPADKLRLKSRRAHREQSKNALLVFVLKKPTNDDGEYSPRPSSSSHVCLKYGVGLFV